MTITRKLRLINKSIPDTISLIAVTKLKPISDIMVAYNAGHKEFGENKIQEMVQKYEELPKDIEWHMIGHLQRNKVKYMAHFVHLIHGVDSFKTLFEINKQAIKNHRVIDCLLQIRIAREETKFGMTFNDVEELLKSEDLARLKNINIKGLMGMASFTENESIIREEFRTLKNNFNIIKRYKSENFSPTIISMGMSGDYKIAIEEGSTLIRVGSAIFGERNYK